tara:strand:- start:6415 stop:7131 length:717 start_codon:yes stop_codon:yes gene_type:complete
MAETVMISDRPDAEQSEVDRKAEAERSMEDRLTGIKDSVDTQSAVMAKILADPDIRKVIEMKEAGQTVTVGNGQTPLKEEPEESPSINIEELSNSEMVQYVTDALKGEVSDLVKSEVSSLREELGQVTGLVKGHQKKEIESEITRLRSKFSDFDNYGQAMTSLADSGVVLPLEDLYWVARRQSGAPMEPSTQVESEKPTSASGKPSRALTRGEDVPRTRGGFGMLLGDALSRTEFNPR